MITKIKNQLVKPFSLFGRQMDGFLLLANFSTFMNFLCGLSISVIIFLGVDINNYTIVRILVFGASWDAIDGKFARRSKFVNKFGKQLDTYADLTTFAIAPALMILQILSDINPITAYISSGLYLFGASFRLSRFMLGKSATSFNGMPSPVAAIFIGSFYAVSIDWFFDVISILMISLIMMSNLKYTSMKAVTSLFDKIHYTFTISLLLLFTYIPDQFYPSVAYTFMAFIYYFVIFGPVHVNYQERRIATASL